MKTENKYKEALVQIRELLAKGDWDADLFEDVSAVVDVTLDEAQEPEADDVSPAAEGIRGARADVKESMFVFLDDLRESGETNMYGARPYLMEEFADLDEKQASAILSEWMKTFGARHPEIAGRRKIGGAQ
jgi:hypothetical protein